MKKTLVLFCFIASMQTAFAQSTDSLFLKYSAAKSDSLRYEAILAVYKTYSEGDPLIFLKASEKFLAYSSLLNLFALIICVLSYVEYLNEKLKAYYNSTSFP